MKEIYKIYKKTKYDLINDLLNSVDYKGKRIFDIKFCMYVNKDFCHIDCDF